MILAPCSVLTRPAKRDLLREVGRVEFKTLTPTHRSCMNQTLENLKNDINNLETRIIELENLVNTEHDHDLKKLAVEEREKLLKQKSALEESVSTLSTTSYSNIENSKGKSTTEINSDEAILEVRAGTGGDEAGIFANDLYNMYKRFSERHSFKISEISRTDGRKNEIRNITAEIKGSNVYSLLKNESGVHRVQRVPVTESGGRIHTSTATVAVLPQVSPVEVEIDPKDLKLEFFHASGHGGQNVNKVQTGVRITHTPTGVISESQEQRSQGQNREKALQILRSRLYTLMQEQQKTLVNELRGDQIGNAERSEKIRTYNYPQDRVTDHRLKSSWHNIPSIMDGEIDEIINSTSTL